MTPHVPRSDAHAHRPRADRPPAYRWLALLPTVGLLGGVPFANRVHPFVLGLPFLLFWIVACVVATSAIVGVVYALDRSRGSIAPVEDGAVEGGR